MRNKAVWTASLVALFLWCVAGSVSAQPPDVLFNLSAEGGRPQAKLLEGSDHNLYGTTCAGGQYGSGSIFMMTPGGTFTTLHSFNGNDGLCPAAELIESGGALYGTASSGGPNGYLGGGTIFRIGMLPGDGLETLHVFDPTNVNDGAYPYAALLEVGGFFYGTTGGGGAHQAGTVFQMDNSTIPPTVTLLHSFEPGGVTIDGWYPIASLIEESGVLYGTTQRGGASDFGTIFSIETTGNNYILLHDFAGGYGAYPYAALVKANGSFYGTTQQLCSSQGGVLLGCGHVFRIDATGNFEGVYFFPDGFMSPVAPLLLGSDGALYGTAPAGGAHNAGVVFRLDISVEPAIGTVRHDFDPATTGNWPAAGLIEINNQLYGTAWLDGPGGAGTIVRVPLAGPTTAQVLHAFGPILPNQVTAGLTEVNGVFYGASQRGGLHDQGALFTFDANGSSLGVIHDFDGTGNGAGPYSGVTVGADGALHGVTNYGGTLGAGLVYRIEPDGSNFQVQHEFDNAHMATDGVTPYARLLATGGMLYGITTFGGAAGAGTIFRIGENGTGFQVLHAFDESIGEGSGGQAGLILGTDGMLYGMTGRGGSLGGGTIFRMNVSGGPIEVLHAFSTTDPNDAAFPRGALTEGRPGVFFGVAPANGVASGGGIVFRLDTNTTPATFTVLKAFEQCCITSPSGAWPGGPLVKGAGGWFYGTTIVGGPGGYGTAFGVSETGAFRMIASFDLTHGGGPWEGLTLASDGSFYGVAGTGGANFNGGVIYRIRGDADADGVLDGLDNCPLASNAGQLDSDGNGIGDACQAVNQPPVADSQSVTTARNTAAGITLTASDADSNPLTFAIVTGPSHGSLSGTAPNLTYTPAPNYSGPDSFTFKANDGTDDSNIATVSITVTSSNHPPVASHGGPYIADLDSPITLDGSGSTDPDTATGDHIVSYSWLINGVMALPGATPTLTAAQINAIGVGSAFVELTVTDTFGASNTASTTLSIYDNQPYARFTAMPNPAACNQGIGFDASASSHGRPDRSIVSYAWSFGDGQTGSGQVANHAYSAFGTYTVTLTVTDNNVPGKTATITHAVTVNLGNQAPIANPGGPYLGDVAAPVTLIGSGSTDPNASCGDRVVLYSWVINNGTTIATTNSNLVLSSAQTAALGTGTFPISLTVSDSFGLISTNSAQTTLTLAGPVASFTATPNPAACQQSVSFNGGASNSRPGRTIVAYAWGFGDGSAVSGPAAIVNHPYGQFGTYTATLTVSDDLGISASTTRTILVNQGNQPPVANPGGPYSIARGSGLSLNGAGSSDPDQSCGDSIVSYNWLINGSIAASGPVPTLTPGQLAGLPTGTAVPVQLTVTDTFGASNVAATTLLVNGEATTTALTALPSTAGLLQPVQLVATVAPAGSGIPSGTVEFRDGASTLGTAVLSAGTASLVVTFATPGPHTMTAAYLGDGTFDGSTSGPVPVAVRPAAESTFTFLVPLTNPQAAGSPIVLAALVRPLTASGSPTGTVEFYEGSLLIGTGTLTASPSGAVAFVSAATPFTTAGAHLFSAKYLGDAAFAPSTAAPVLISLYTGARPAATTTTVASGPNPSAVGDNVTVTATVTGGATTGFVAFWDNGSFLGSGVILNVGGVFQATLTVPTLARGVHVIMASYAGSSGFAASNSLLPAVQVVQ